MNLRILKKLSKRAAELLPLVGCDIEPFPAEKWANYHGTHGKHDRKHWERGNARYPVDYSDRLYFPSRRGLGNPYIEKPSHPLKGTMMIGWMSGYETPEWDETDAWARLVDTVAGHFTDWKNFDEARMTWPECRRRLGTPRDVFRAVPEVIAAVQKEKAERDRVQAEFRARWKKGCQV